MAAACYRGRGESGSKRYPEKWRAIVGQRQLQNQAELASFSVPETTKILIGEVTVVDEANRSRTKTVSDSGVHIVRKISKKR